MTDSLPPVPRWLLRRYLLAHKWNVISRASFELFTQDGVELVVPLAGDRPDFIRGLEIVIGSLSQFEERAPAEVLADVRAVGFDVLRSRVPNSSIINDGISLDRAAEFVRHAKDLLAASATTELEPRRAFARNLKEGLDYSNRCFFGHTFRGSFGFVIESPVSPNDEPVLLADGQSKAIPLERRVVERLVRGIQTLDVATQHGDVEAVVSAHTAGLSANMCEELVALVEKVSPSGINFDVSFSPEWPTDVGTGANTIFNITHRHAELASEAAVRLRKLDIDANQTVFGRVVRLETEADPSELLEVRGAREIAIDWASTDFGNIRVRMRLSPSDYLLAVEAHRGGRFIKVSGQLQRRGRLWWLEDTTSFELISGD